MDLDMDPTLIYLKKKKKASHFCGYGGNSEHIWVFKVYIWRQIKRNP